MKTVPSSRETVGLVAVSAFLFAFTILQIQDYSSAVRNFGDSPDYTDIASAIRHWDFKDLHVKQFWGYPYAMVTVSSVTRLSDQGSLLLISFAASVASILLAYRLWGGWIAGFFAVLNFDWMQRSFLGGSEPLFVLLLLAFFLSARKEKWVVAASLASLATITRPVGILAISVLGVLLLSQRKYKELALCTSVALTVGILYILPFWIVFHDPLYEFYQYKAADWGSGIPVGVPFRAIIFNLVHSDAPWTSIVLNCGWLALVSIGSIALLFSRSRPYASQYPIEFWFAVAYVAFLFTYNSPKWAFAEFPRFAIPVLPMLFVALTRWFPHDRRILWALGVVSPVLAAASALGIRNVAHTLLH